MSETKTARQAAEELIAFRDDLSSLAKQSLISRSEYDKRYVEYQHLVARTMRNDADRHDALAAEVKELRASVTYLSECQESLEEAMKANSDRETCTCGEYVDECECKSAGEAAGESIRFSPAKPEQSGTSPAETPAKIECENCDGWGCEICKGTGFVKKHEKPAGPTEPDYPPIVRVPEEFPKEEPAETTTTTLREKLKGGLAAEAKPMTAKKRAKLMHDEYWFTLDDEPSVALCERHLTAHAAERDRQIAELKSQLADTINERNAWNKSYNADCRKLESQLAAAKADAEANREAAETLRRIKGGAYIIAGNDLLEKASLTAAKGGDETDS